ncbi:hypothetical protein [Clostridium grantii]|uniref:2'-5' RNA ligase superfamily protein n=1 Tax=Clostridium grantii DSM 8605 TaxID=1121316 RepID=A0A1M5W5N6_9CLOT|nr:hypothetical protein [Clostridium grantii]SHH82780.1 hypothetical protein SAMN02745207_02685 [Clostridium grantii DSM 8605]
MKYQLVALFDQNSNEFIDVIQRDLCKKYRVYKLKSDFCIPLQSFNDANIDEFTKIIQESITPYKKFKVQITPQLFLDDYSKLVGLKVDKSGYINKISRTLSDTLALHGFNSNNHKCDFGIPVVSSNYHIRKMFKEKPSCAINIKNNLPYLGFAKIERLELRKSINNKKDILIKSFPLRDY